MFEADVNVDVDGDDCVDGQVLEEIDTVLHGEAPDFNSAGNMPYLRAVIHETMRCCRVVR